MATLEEEAQAKRKKRTILLLTFGGVTLVLPLLAIFYIKMNENAAKPASSAVMFERREEGDAKVNLITGPSALPLPGTEKTPEAAGSSLDFVKSGTNAEKPPEGSEPPPPAEAAAPPEPVQEAAPAPTAPAKPAKKAFNTPKLQGTKSFSSFKGKGAPLGGSPAGRGGGPPNIPGMDDPEVQKYLRSQGK